MATVRDRVELVWETYFPSFFGLAAGISTYYFGPAAFAHMKEQNFQIGSIYSSVFDVSTIFTAFLLTFYTFVVTTDRGFIGRAKGTRPYRLLLAYTLRALVLGAVLTALSIPMTIVEPTPVSHADHSLYAVAIWLGITVWTMGAFVRAAHLFSIFAGEHA